ncbi:hypothetical protein EF847_18655 [Actinobacteria bacterium YIM 96077]|uniref:Uncharacterized protein n=1 Tax=Phytoactinopolyspora halophila TaxID=1981511 RepID=A0A329QMP1_9ACTN|nr:hypothetical protein [Phytoactinopolyspora halophila]AYY14411.1 hypothetical protein EF847_18655 [Actinobacteria bacterium YIM 96077]RAW11868.1 hypothetical protein DPM12_15465 [Phytoactinopolyspora halophila]
MFWRAKGLWRRPARANPAVPAALGAAAVTAVSLASPALAITAGPAGMASRSEHDGQRGADVGVEVTDVDGRMDQIVELLDDDPIVMDRAMGNGDAAAVRELLRSDLDDFPHQAYVVLVNRLPGDDLPRREDDPFMEPEEMARLLHNRIGEDALYVVGIDQTVHAIAPGLDDVAPEDAGIALHGATYEVDGELTPAAEARAYLWLAPQIRDPFAPDNEEIAVDAVAELAEDPLMLRTKVDFFASEAERELTASPSKTSPDRPHVAVGIVAAITVAVVANAYLNHRAARQAAIGEPTDVAPARERFQAALAELDRWRREPETDPLATAPGGPPGEGEHAPETDAGHRERVRTYADAALALRHSDDPADIVGGAVLAEYAVAAAREGPQDPPRPCFLNPMHGEHATTTPVPGDPSSVRVPACERCAGAVQRGELPDILRIRDGRKVQPYYHRQDVWSVSGCGALRDDVADLVLAGARAGTALPGRLAHER